MQLTPCGECRRHVDVSEAACPFCSAPLTAEPARSSRLGRMSRAAVFASAALAGSACGGKKPADTMNNKSGGDVTASSDAGVEQPPPPPPDDRNNIPMPYGAPPARSRVV